MNKVNSEEERMVNFFKKVAEVKCEVDSKESHQFILSDNAPSFLRNEKLRLVIFSGKGGTGKTTSACALGIYLAKSYPDKKFLVASSDPAHSLADSFDCPVEDSITPIKGLDNLWAIEMDSVKLLGKFKEKYKNYLENFSKMAYSTDQIDLRDFLTFKLPGMHEIMFLLEIVDLLSFGIFRPYQYDLVIWDTAPTGHTLRLLQFPDKVLKWIEIFKLSFSRYAQVSIGVATLGFHIPGYRPPKGNVRMFLDKLSKELEKIRDILKSEEECEFVPVTILEELSIAETERLLSALRQEEISIRNIIVNRVQGNRECPFCSSRSKEQEDYLKEIEEKFASYNLIKLPLFPNEVRGQERLLEFAKVFCGEEKYSFPLQSLSQPLDEDRFIPGELSEILEKDLHFIIFSGKGGVGKTTLSSVTALALAKYNPNKRILVFSTDPAHSLADSFALSIGDVVTPIKDQENLYALEINGTKLYEDFKKEYKLNIEDAFNKWQDSQLASISGRKWKLDHDQKVMIEFVETYPPGLEEVLALEKIMDFIKKEEFDVYVFDTAPTGHLVELMKFPELVREWLRVSYRGLLKYQREFPLDNIEILAKKILSSQETVLKMRALLTDSQKSEFIAVTISEEMGLLETKDLLKIIQSLGIPCRHIVVNMITPATDCSFCSFKRRDQLDCLNRINSQIYEKKIIKVPLYPHEIRGIDNLKQLSEFLYRVS
ncbi:MAG: ArsA family ATPase [Candidatus Omnitrophica bacterium]|nr:ArsA family ATPase [Candidatus Omnitrophota bacterium]